MNTTTVRMLEFYKIKEMLISYAVSEQGKRALEKLEPSIDHEVVQHWLIETTEARHIIDKRSNIPLHPLTGLDQVLTHVEKGFVLNAEQLTQLLSFLDNTRKLKQFMNDKEVIAPRISQYAYSMYDLAEVVSELLRCIRHGKVDDLASKELHRIRKKLRAIDEKIKTKLSQMLKSSTHADQLQDNVISMRDGRYVIPVKQKYKRSIEGQILDQSSSGQTVYIEPEEIRKLQNEMNQLQMEEAAEEHKILGQLTELVHQQIREISINLETMIHYDFIFAKGRLSKALNGRTVELNTENRIKLVGAKHPLLGSEAVPLDVHIGIDFQSLVITGPNTGGKTVAIKTVGLISLMVQAGLHVPVQLGSEVAVFWDIFVDIGDGQSIEQNLSTFSSHMTNIISILACAKQNTLVLLDEVGAGTDPREGMGLAITILEEIHQQGATLFATTHYSEIKEFAEQTPGFENASMAFDIETLQPLYKLSIGAAGESQAFSIALRLGMKPQLLEKAYQYAYKSNGGRKGMSEKIEIDFKREGLDIEQPSQLPTQKPHQQEIIQTHQEKLEYQRKRQQFIKKKSKQEEQDKKKSCYKLGDRVYISSLKAAGVICDEENNAGELGVLVQGKRIKVNKKRLSLQIDAKELYPEDYDLSIVLETKENRKKNKLMNKKYVEGLKIEREDHDN